MKTRTNQPVTDYEGIVEGLEEQASINGVKIYEDIKDKDGHYRFIEGDGTPEEITGLTTVYCKWSLSGSHLMMVFAASVASATTITNGSLLCQFALPTWVMDKIYPVWGVQNNLEVVSGAAYGEDWSTQNFGYVVQKDTTAIKFKKVNDITTTAKRSFRFECDLLIDNDSGE